MNGFKHTLNAVSGKGEVQQTKIAGLGVGTGLNRTGNEKRNFRKSKGNHMPSTTSKMELKEQLISRLETMANTLSAELRSLLNPGKSLWNTDIGRASKAFEIYREVFDLACDVDEHEFPPSVERFRAAADALDCRIRMLNGETMDDLPEHIRRHLSLHAALETLQKVLSYAYKDQPRHIFGLSQEVSESILWFEQFRACLTEIAERFAKNDSALVEI